MIKIMTIFPKKIEDKYTIKEFERIKKEREDNDEDNEDNINKLNIKKKLINN